MTLSRFALVAALIGNIGLIASLYWIADSLEAGRLILATLCALPLFFSLVGLLRARVYTAAWASMATLFYFGYALVEYIARTSSLAVDLCLAASVIMFTGCVLFARWDAREQQAREDAAQP